MKFRGLGAATIIVAAALAMSSPAAVGQSDPNADGRRSCTAKCNGQNAACLKRAINSESCSRRARACRKKCDTRFPESADAAPAE